MSARKLARAALVSLALLVTGAVSACTPSLENGTVCGQAAEMLGTCGVLLPFTADPDSCTGDQEAVARCIASSGGSCDALAGLSTHLNDCLDVDGGTTLPTRIPGLGLGDLDGSVFTQDGSRGDDDDASSDADADAGARSGGGRDSSTEASTGPGGDASAALLDVTDAVAAGETRSYQTVRLGPGSYLFTLTGQVGAQLHLRKIADGSTDDCVVNADAAGETCRDTITRSAVLYADVVGDGSAATFHLLAVTETP